MKVQRYQKAIAAAAVPVFSALLLWISSGELNTSEFALALSGLFAALVVYVVPNIFGDEDVDARDEGGKTAEFKPRRRRAPSKE
jgi:hypothetical protein